MAHAPPGYRDSSGVRGLGRGVVWPDQERGSLLVTPSEQRIVQRAAHPPAPPRLADHELADRERARTRLGAARPPPGSASRPTIGILAARQTRRCSRRCSRPALRRSGRLEMGVQLLPVPAGAVEVALLVGRAPRRRQRRASRRGRERPQRRGDGSPARRPRQYAPSRAAGRRSGRSGRRTRGPGASRGAIPTPSATPQGVGRYGQIR